MVEALLYCKGAAAKVISFVVAVLNYVHLLAICSIELACTL